MVPGWTGSGPDHWQTLWERSLPGCRRVVQRDWDHPTVAEWVDALHRAITAAPAPPVLIAYSLGSPAVAHWAGAHRHPVHAALLVAPPDVERPGTPAELRSFAPIPTRPLPFRTVVVASDHDPWMPVGRAQAPAGAWGAEFVAAGAAGHLNAAAGYGPWPAGEPLVRELLGLPGAG